MCPPSNACDCDGKENVDQLEAAITPTPSFVKANGVLRGETVALEVGQHIVVSFHQILDMDKAS